MAAGDGLGCSWVPWVGLSRAAVDAGAKVVGLRAMIGRRSNSWPLVHGSADPMHHPTPRTAAPEASRAAPTRMDSPVVDELGPGASLGRLHAAGGASGLPHAAHLPRHDGSPFPPPSPSPAGEGNNSSLRGAILPLAEPSFTPAAPRVCPMGRGVSLGTAVRRGGGFMEPFRHDLGAPFRTMVGGCTVPWLSSRGVAKGPWLPWRPIRGNAWGSL